MRIQLWFVIRLTWFRFHAAAARMPRLLAAGCAAVSLENFGDPVNAHSFHDHLQCQSNSILPAVPKINSKIYCFVMTLQ
jgi:hypothetical protein